MEVLGAVGVLAVIIIVWYILQILADWKIFEKAGKPGWHSLIPILNVYDEYNICWNGVFGLIWFAAAFAASAISADAAEESTMLSMASGGAGIVMMVLHIVESYKLSKAFGHGVGYTIFLILFDRIARMILGFGSSEYVGKDE